MAEVGYEYLRTSLNLTAFQPDRPATVRAVTRVQVNDSILAVPASVAPQTSDPLVHVLFALKHEGVNMQVLAQALPLIPADRLQAEIALAPNGIYIRTACYLWETLTGKSLGPRPDIVTNYVSLFDEQAYVTGPAVRNQRWRVIFNGLGTPHYCVTVRRTAKIEAAIKSDILGRARSFGQQLGRDMLDRTLAWAYLHETEDSYAIEREAPTEDKARAFITLLKQAHQGRALSEDYLVELQSSVVSNPFDRAVQFRVAQNWLRGPNRGAAGVTYVPPPPADVYDLMTSWMDFSNHAPRYTDPIVAASIASFGFVYIHPFMDGNGRLSRFLFHKALCASGQLEDGMLLPVSVAMKRHEREYLQTLQHFSSQARERVGVTWIDGDDFVFDWKADSSIFRYWDATECVEFGFKMADQALDVELRQETRFLCQFDAVKRAVDERYDVRGSILATLIADSLHENGALSKNKRKRYAALVQEETFDYIEKMSREALSSAGENEAATKNRMSDEPGAGSSQDFD
jgi:hypothetical protein